MKRPQCTVDDAGLPPGAARLAAGGRPDTTVLHFPVHLIPKKYLRYSLRLARSGDRGASDPGDPAKNEEQPTHGEKTPPF